MSQDEFTKLFTYMQAGFTEVNAKLENMATKDDVQGLLNAIDGHAGRLDDIETDNTARDAQFDRLTEWAKPVGNKVGIPLTDL